MSITWGSMPVKSLRKQRRKDESLVKQMNDCILSELLSATKPDYSESNLPPIEIKKTRFDYEKPDFSRLTECMTEDEIIASVIYPEKHQHRKVTIDEYANAGAEVVAYWKEKIAESLLRRGRAYKKIDSIVDEKTMEIR